MLPCKTYIARHGETVFNAAARMQGDHVHTPLTRAGFAQADAMGAALARCIGQGPPLTLWSSPSGRALQTLAIVAEHLALDWHIARTDDRLREIDLGDWGGRSYAEIVAEGGPVLDRESGLFVRFPDAGERYHQIADRLRAWIDVARNDPGDRLVIMHGMSARVLRGLLTGRPVDARWGTGIADHLPQGSMVAIEDGVETLVHRGGGTAPA